MKKALYVKDFTIKSRRTGSRLRGRENEVVYDIFTADMTRQVKSDFSTKRAAQEWRSASVARVNKVLSGEAWK